MAGTLDEVLWLLQLPRMISLHERILRSFPPHEAIPFVAIPVRVGFMYDLLFFRAGLVGLFVFVARYPLKTLLYILYTLLEIYNYLHCIVQHSIGKWMESMQVATANFEEKIADRELTNLSHSWHVEKIFEFVTPAPIFNDRDIYPSTLAQHQLCIKATVIHTGPIPPASLHAFSPQRSTPLSTLCNPRPCSTSELYSCKSTNVFFWYVLFAVDGSTG